MRIIAALLFILSSTTHGEVRFQKSVAADGSVTLKPLAAEDVNGDGNVDQGDVLAVQQTIAANAATQPAPPTPHPAPVAPASRAASLPATPANCTVTVGPDDKWQAAVGRARAGDTICFRGGDYKTGGRGQNYEACLAINSSGEPGKPITFRNVPGERPIFYGEKVLWAIRVGYVKHDGTPTGVHDIIVDGLCATQAPWDGIEVAQSSNVVIRNCEAFANNFNSPNGYKAGINIDAPARDVTIDHCRVYDNGFGISAYEDSISSTNPMGVKNITISNNFIFGNSRTGNAGNSSGLGLRFPDHATIEGNILYDNPDAGINGEGHNFCRVVRNICINNWQPLPGANNEGIKICVRGGGCNVIAFNLSVSNGNCGYDAAGGVGDVVLNNTFYKNKSWGVLAEGRETMLFNNIVAANSTGGGNAYIEIDALGFSLISDWNVFGPGPLPYQRPTPAIPIPANTRVQSVTLGGLTLPRTDPREVNPPEKLWGVSTIEEARSKIIAAYKPSPSMPGVSIAKVQSVCNANIGAVKAACDASVAAEAASPDFQMKQATSRWKALKVELTAYDLTGLKDLSDKTIDVNSSINAGAIP